MSRKRPRLAIENDEHSEAMEEKPVKPISNIAHETPYAGMKLEIRDSDFIWSSGYLVDVIKGGGSNGSGSDGGDGSDGSDDETTVIVASDGWGRQWDEELVWPSERLARLYTYTKRVKCILDLLPKPRRKPSLHQLDQLPKGAFAGFSSGWPVSVQFRMPHPGLAHGEEMLRMEDKVFVQPYGMKYLPENVQKTMAHDGGCWFHHGRLRLWKEDPKLMGILPRNFMEAFRIAQSDRSVKGFLVPKALEKNSLLNAVYRVHYVKGAKVKDGKLVATEAPLVPRPPQGIAEDQEFEVTYQADETHDEQRQGGEVPARNPEAYGDEEKSGDKEVRFFGRRNSPVFAVHPAHSLATYVPGIEGTTVL